MIRKLKTKFSVVPLIFIIVTMIVGGVEYFTDDTKYIPLEEKLNIYYLDVGQGDCTYIVFPDGRNMLIDAGEKDSNSELKLSNFEIDKIDYVVITHPHSDHAGGMERIVENYEIGEILMTDAVNATDFFYDLLDTIEKEDILVKEVYDGYSIINQENLKAQVISPGREGYEDLNNMSIILKLTYGENEFLFTGDAEREAEESLKGDISADVLKVGHHGSKTSSTYEFLERVNPKYAIISLGEFNSYGHPHSEVLNRLEDFGTTVYRTDKQGDITVVSDGVNIEITTEK